MFSKIINFIKYHNAFSIGFMLVFVGFNVSLAASEDLRDNFISSQNSVQSVDNSYILAVDLDNLNFDLQIKEITEDAEKYYVVYNYRTVAVADYVWQDVNKEKILTVSRAALDGRDLGLYVAEELGENIDYELSYLKEAQALEKKKGLTQKIATTEYAGLVGKFLSPEEKVFPGYEPVVVEPEPKIVVAQAEPPAVAATSTPAPTFVEQPIVEQPAQQANQGSIDRELIRQIVQEMLDQTALDDTQTTATSSDDNFVPPTDDTFVPPVDDDPVLPLPPTPTCDPNNLNLCNENNCSTANGHWYNNVCNAEENSEDPEQLEQPEETATSTSPVITLTQTSITLTVGDTFDPTNYATTEDPDGDTVTQYASSSVDTTTVGTYSVEYTAEDEHGMWAEPQTLTVIVEAPVELVCDTTNLNLCDETNCSTDASGYWYNSECHVEAPVELVCDTENLNLCDENNCATNASGYWYSEVCNSTCQEFTFYQDSDNDTFGDSNNSTFACELPDNYVTNSDDCDDNNADINPNATEVCGNDIDENCDGKTDSEDEISCPTPENNGSESATTTSDV